VFGFAVEAGTSFARLLVDVPAELRCDLNLVPKWSHTFSEKTFHLVRPVSFGGVEKRHAEVEGRPDDLNHFVPTRHRGFIPPRHVLDAQPHRRDLQSAKLAASDRLRRLAGCSAGLANAILRCCRPNQRRGGRQP